jgi:4-amino-4-deoxy-L-arabinose transferase-like glycosyltransferase
MLTSTVDRPAEVVRPSDEDRPRHGAGGRGRGWPGRLVRGRPEDPSWARPALLALLAATALLYCWDLAASGMANTFYAAAVQAGSQSWKAWFFGALDPASFITVDKPPAALWVMGLSARLFGFDSWSLLLPQALAGVAAVGLLYGAVRRWSGPAAGLVAGAALALTPAAALMFRFNNPDALLTLLLVAGAYCTVRAIERAGTRWLLLAGAALGFAFLAKMLQGFLVLPAFALAYLIAAPTTLWRRVWQTLLAGVAVVVAAGWWVAVAQLWPAASRPYIGGSTDGTVLNLVWGYNGLGRIFGGGGSGGGGMSGGQAGSSFGGPAGLARLFGSEMGAEVSWLLPAAIIALVCALWTRRHAPRTDLVRAALVLWGGWMIVTGLVFSYMQGIVHPYYTVALAPGIAALVAVGGRELWHHRSSWTGRAGLAAVVAAAAVWSVVLLGRNAAWHPELRYAIAVVGGLAVVGLLVPPHTARRVGAIALIAGILSGLGGTAAYAVATAATPHSGSIPTVGPASAGGGGMGAGMGGGTSSTALSTLLREAGTTWSAATVGSQSAAQLELDSGTSVLAIGGWSGSDNAPTLAQFQALVSAGRIHYYLTGGAGGGGGPGGGRGTTSAIGTWVAAYYPATTVGNQTVYDLTTPTS